MSVRSVQRFNFSRSFKLLIADLGLNSAEVLRCGGLPPATLERADGSLSAEEYFRVWDGLEQLIGADQLPLRIAAVIRVESFNPALFASLCSPNLQLALQRLRQYKRLIGPMRLELQQGAQYTSVQIQYLSHQDPLPGTIGLAEMVFLTQLARLATRHTIMPLRVEVARLPANLAEYEKFFGVVPVAGRSDRLFLRAEDMLRPFVTADAISWDFFEPHLNQRLYALNEETAASQRVRYALLEMLPAGISSIDEVARRLSMSRRSLQRHLQAEGIAYQDLLSELRQELAQHYLSRSPLSSGEISYLLGFQDANSFIRAFNRWTGTTPGEFRRRMAYQ